MEHRSAADEQQELRERRANADARASEREVERERRRTPSGRRATDGLKMECPFCRDVASAVVSSYGATDGHKVRRRRECVGCGDRFPTSEQVDWTLLARELEARGDAIARALTEGVLRPTWENAFMLLHRAWGEAREGQYPGVNQSLSSLDDMLRRLQRAA